METGHKQLSGEDFKTIGRGLRKEHMEEMDDMLVMTPLYRH